MTSSKAGLPSRYVTEGVESSFHRVFYYAMGLDSEEIHQPHVGVVTAWDDRESESLRLRSSAVAVKDHLWSFGLTPREFTTIPGYDDDATTVGLAARELIADSCELTVRGHCYDGLVGFADSSRALAGLAMAMLRLDVPSVLVPCLTAADRGEASGLVAALDELGLTVDDDLSMEAVAEDLAGRLRQWRRPRTAVTADALASAAQRCGERAAPVEALVHLAALAHEVGERLAVDVLAAEAASGAAEHGVVYAWLGDAGSPLRAVYSGPSLPGTIVRRARCFEQEHEAVSFAATRWLPSDEVIVLREQGVRGTPGARSCGDLIDVVARRAGGVTPVVWTDGLAPLHPEIALICCSTPEAVDGGLIGTVDDGTDVMVNVDAGTLSCSARVARERVPVSPSPRSTMQWKYTQLVRPLIDGATTHPGASAEGVCYADL